MPGKPPPETPKTTLPAFTPVPRKMDRHNGWKPEVQRAFIEALAETGSVRAACRRVNRSDHGAYMLRRHPEAESFRQAWDAALDLGVRRIEDAAMDRALYGTEETIHYHGDHIATRRRYNERLVMFMLRNRRPDRFADGQSPAQKGAIGKMEKRRLKKKWRKQWEAERSKVSTADVRASIESRVRALRKTVEARRLREWRELSAETREAYRHYEALRARDTGADIDLPEYALTEEQIAALDAEEAKAREDAGTEGCEEALPLPPPEFHVGPRKNAEVEENPRTRTLKDESWRD